MSLTSLRSFSDKSVSETYDLVLEVAWNFDYHNSISKLDDLYNRAKENQWDCCELDWDIAVDAGNPAMCFDGTPYAQIPFFQSLSEQQQQTFTAHSTAQLLSQFLHAGQGALLTAATVVNGVPDIKAKCVAATQAMDEARHIESYHRYINKLAIQYPMVPWLKNLVDLTLNSNNHCKVLIGMNLIIEGMALGALSNMYRQTSEPLLKSLTFNVMRDEARHVSFGHLYLMPTIAKLHMDDREELAQFAFESVKVVVDGHNCSPDQGFLDVLSISGIEPLDFYRSLEEAEASGASHGLNPGHIHSLNDLMLPSLMRAGLITARTKELFSDIGVSINADLAGLEAMATPAGDAIGLNAEQPSTN